MDIAIAIVAGIVGILVGSLINVLADDLPMRENPRRPHYPDGTPRKRSAWLGVTAFLSGQREAPEKAGIEHEANAADEPAPVADGMLTADRLDSEPRRPTSRRLGWRHPITELVTGLAFAGMVLAFKGESHLPIWLVYVAIMILITVIDIEHRLILFVVVVPSCILALVVAAVSPERDKDFREFLFGGLFGFAIFFAMFLGGGVFAILTRHEGVAFGFGDVMLATLSGFILGWRAFIFAALITVFAGAFGSVLYIIARSLAGRRYKWFTPLPYGPYIVLGTLLMLLLREEVTDLISGQLYQ